MQAHVNAIGLILCITCLQPLFSQNYPCGLHGRDTVINEISAVGCVKKNDYPIVGSEQNRMRFTPVKQIRVIFHLFRDDNGNKNEFAAGWNHVNHDVNQPIILGYTEFDYIKNFIFNHPIRYEISPGANSELCDMYAYVNYIYRYNNNQTITGENPAEKKHCFFISDTNYFNANPCSLTVCSGWDQTPGHFT